MPRGPASVPCGGCTLCCKSGELIAITADDVPPPGGYQMMEVPAIAGLQALAQRPGGACVYVTDAGCSIHQWAPMVCKAFSCAGLYAMTPRHERRRFARGDAYVQALYKQGRKMHTLLGRQAAPGGR